jgi:hypothetical protein
MRKKKKKSKKPKKSTKRLGRPEELKIEDLPKRFRDMKTFLENYWGRVGLGLRRVRQPEDVKSILNLVQGIEWMVSFKGHAACLITPVAIEVTPNELRATRRKHKIAETEEQCRWTEYHETTPKAQQAEAALQEAISQFGNVLDRFDFFLVLSLIADKLKVKELTTRTPELLAAVLKAQTEKNALKDALSAQEAWFARNEVVKFARNRRYSKSLLNFARAMAGLPEWGWFHSRRTCETIRDKSGSTSPHKVFELLTIIIRKTKPLSLSRVEKRFRAELLRSDADPMLKGYVTPQWDYLEEAIHSCKGKEFKRSELPFKIMDRFIYHTERGKRTIDIELAKRNELV